MGILKLSDAVRQHDIVFTPQAHVTMELNIDTYFDKDIDERQVQKSFQF